MGMKAGTQNGCTAQETTSKAQQKMEEGVVLIIYIYNCTIEAYKKHYTYTSVYAHTIIYINM